MRTFKNLMQKVLVAVLSIAMAITFTPDAAFTVSAADTTFRTIFLGGSDRFNTEGNFAPESFEVALFKNGEKIRTVKIGTAEESTSYTEPNLETEDELGNPIEYKWKMISKDQVPEGFVARVEPQTKESTEVFLIRFYVEGEIEITLKVLDHV